ncbi:hypothetical protein EDD22DRAFT_183974 [Suillus occidentalis]|nr:hypothetical protein EDD22DRAFT_183974 [Suillus occidentalis]
MLRTSACRGDSLDSAESKSYILDHQRGFLLDDLLGLALLLAFLTSPAIFPFICLLAVPSCPRRHGRRLAYPSSVCPRELSRFSLELPGFQNVVACARKFSYPVAAGVLSEKCNTPHVLFFLALPTSPGSSNHFLRVSYGGRDISCKQLIGENFRSHQSRVRFGTCSRLEFT